MLGRFSKYDLPPNVVAGGGAYIGRSGKLKVVGEGANSVLRSDDAPLIAEVARQKRMQSSVLSQPDQRSLVVDPARRGHVKQALVTIGYPAEDLAGYTTGEPLAFSVRDETLAGQPFTMRQYQTDSVAAFHAGGSVHGGSGVIVLACGVGKTIVGIWAMAAVP